MWAAEKITAILEVLNMNDEMDTGRQRYIVVFGKNAVDLEEKLNNPNFVPSGYKLVQLTFNS